MTPTVSGHSDLSCAQSHSSNSGQSKHSKRATRTLCATYQEKRPRKTYPEGAVLPLQRKTLAPLFPFLIQNLTTFMRASLPDFDVLIPYPRCMATSLIQCPDHWQWLWKWRMIFAAISTLHFCTFLGVFIRLSKSLYLSFVSEFFFSISLQSIWRGWCVPTQLCSCTGYSGILKTTFAADLYETQHSVLQTFGNGVNFHLEIEKYLNSEF